MDACSDALGLPLTAAYSTAHVQPPACRTFRDRPGATCAQHQRGYEALSRERGDHERFGRSEGFVTLLTDLGVHLHVHVILPYSCLGRKKAVLYEEVGSYSARRRVKHL